MEKYLKLNLQLFSDGVIDIEDEHEEDEEHHNHPPMPLAVVPLGGNHGMPSSIPGEAWRNLEELMVTMSNNFRVSLEHMKGEFSTLTGNVDQRLNAVEHSVEQLRSLMDEFKTILHNATVEVPAEPEKDEKPKSRGYMSRRGG